MELLFVTVIGAALGGIVRYTLPHRSTYGALLLPALGAIAAAVVWVGLLWSLNLTFDGTWIWVASLAASVIVPVVVALLLPRQRADHDAKLLATLSRA